VKISFNICSLVEEEEEEEEEKTNAEEQSWV
jgi:hypothetical protein